MTRTTDPDDHEHFQPLGAPIRKPEPAPAQAPKPQGPSGIVTDADGRMRTTVHKPHVQFDPAQIYWGWPCA